MNPELLPSRTAPNCAPVSELNENVPLGRDGVGHPVRYMETLTMSRNEQNRAGIQLLLDLQMTAGKENASRPVVIAGRVIKHPGLADLRSGMRINRFFLLLIGKGFR